LLLPFAAEQCRQPIDRLTIKELSASAVRRFLQHVEESRHCATATRNQRLTAICALARFVAQHSPEHIAWCGEIRRIPFKKSTQAVVPYLEKAEMDAVLASPDRNTSQGQRDYALLLFLYNSGARASEAAHVTIADLDLAPSPSVKILGKGNKVRHCPLWPAAAQTLAPMVAAREPAQRVFLNRCGQPITRFGIHTLVERYALKAAVQMSSLAHKRVSPHTIRHTTAVHLLRAGVDINTIRAWLGHVSLASTNVYAEIDLEMKAKALATCEVTEPRKPRKRWAEDRNLMAFLHSL
jgi:site-specific recombinase XerD